jgi:hypothetical protein
VVAIVFVTQAMMITATAREAMIELVEKTTSNLTPSMISRKAAVDVAHSSGAAQSRYLAVSRWCSVRVGICGAEEEAQRAASARRRPTGIALNNDDGDTVASSPGSADASEAREAVLLRRSGARFLPTQDRFGGAVTDSGRMKAKDVPSITVIQSFLQVRGH